MGNGHMGNGHMGNGHMGNGHMGNGHMGNGHMGNGICTHMQPGAFIDFAGRVHAPAAAADGARRRRRSSATGARRMTRADDAATAAQQQQQPENTSVSRQVSPSPGPRARNIARKKNEALERLPLLCVVSASLACAHSSGAKGASGTPCRELAHWRRDVAPRTSSEKPRHSGRRS